MSAESTDQDKIIELIKSLYDLRGRCLSVGMRMALSNAIDCLERAVKEND